MKTFEPDARALAAAAHDGVMLCLAVLAATVLIEVDGGANAPPRDLATAFAIAVPIQITMNVLFGVYQGVWRYTSLPDIQRIVFAVLSGAVFISIALHYADLNDRLGHREYVLYPLFLIAMMSTSRMAFRSLREWSLYGRGGEQGTQVVIMGAGDAAVGLVKELSRSQEW